MLIVTLIDKSQALTDAWKHHFESILPVHVHCGDYFEVEADAMVSPANSFGFMDGGIDLAIRNTLGREVEQAVRQTIFEFWRELPVGCADTVSTGDKRWPWLVIAPTMRIPQDVSQTPNAYLAFYAALQAIESHNEAVSDGETIESLVCCGLGTGIGKMPPDRCAHQMRVAWDRFTDPPTEPMSAQAVLMQEYLMYGTENS